MPISSYPPAVAGSWTELATTTLSSPTSTISFTSISTSYSRFLLSWNALAANASGGTLILRMNNDSGSNYTWLLDENGATMSCPSTGKDTSIFLGALPGTSISGSGFVSITGANDIYKSINSSLFRPGGGALGQGQWYDATAINRLDLIITTTSSNSGTVKLYGAN